MTRAPHREVDAFMRALAEGTRPTRPLPPAGQIRLRVLGRARLKRTRRALRPILAMQALSLLAGLAGGVALLALLAPARASAGEVAAPETLSLIGPSLSGGSALLGTLALAALAGLAVVVTAFSDA